MLDTYSIPRQSEQLLFEGILKNEKQRGLPAGILSHASKVRFEGTRLPSIAINWRFAESIAALKGFEAAMLGVLLERKYGIKAPLETVINTDHAQLLFMSSLVLTVSPPAHFEVNPTPVRELSEKYSQFFPLQDPHRFASTFHLRAATKIYKTSDGKYIHIHGSLNPDPKIKALGLLWDRPEIKTREDSYQEYMEVVGKYKADELDMILNEEYYQACTIVKSPEEYANSEHGRATAETNLYDIDYIPSEVQEPCWWPSNPTLPSQIKRPLAGVKVVDLTRVIAGPSATRGLAELGASVMRVSAKHLPDFTGLHPDLNWGKWNCCLDLRDPLDVQKLRELILDADIVVDGYRPGVFEKYGFGVFGVLNICKDRKRGVIYARENSYGWRGPWKHRSGLQPISDANTGISYSFGVAMGTNEPCTPVFPNSDYCTGIAGCVGVLEALISRASKGGSYVVNFALNYYNHWLSSTVGTYRAQVWEEVWARNGRKVFRYFESMNVTVPAYLEMLKQTGSETLFKEEFFERRLTKCLELEMQVVRPGIRFPERTVELGYSIGTRGNGVDAPRWPDDRTVERIE